MKNLFLNIILVLFTSSLVAQNLTLDSTKVLALENNKRIKETRLKLETSEKVKQNAFTNYFPKVSASAFVVQSTDYLLDIQTPEMNLPVYDGNPANIANATQFAYVPSLSIQTLDYANTAVITATQPLYAGGRIRNGNKLANIGEEISQYQLNLSTDQVLTMTEDYYWKLVALKEKELTLESYEKLLHTLKKEVQDFYDAGFFRANEFPRCRPR